MDMGWDEARRAEFLVQANDAVQRRVYHGEPSALAPVWGVLVGVFIMSILIYIFG